MTDLEQAIRRMLAEELVGTAIKAQCGATCPGLARKIECGFDHNPRTLAAVNIIRRLLEVTDRVPTASDAA